MTIRNNGTEQPDLIMRHLHNKGPITSLQAINLYGITRLSAVIHSLRRKEHFDIKDTWRIVKNRFGHDSIVKEYFIERDK